MLNGLYKINGIGDRPFLYDGTFIWNSPNLVTNLQDSNLGCSKIYFFTFDRFPGLAETTIISSENIGTVCVGNTFLFNTIFWR
jgi:hypothetical protein